MTVVRQASETDGLFVFSCLCSSSRTTLVLTLGAEDVYIVCRKAHTHYNGDMHHLDSVLNWHSGTAAHFSLMVAVCR